MDNKVNKGTPKNNLYDGDDYAFFGLSLGMCLGIATGKSLFGNSATGMCLGMLLGFVIGAAVKKK